MFKVGNRVIYTSGVRGDASSNPLWGGAYGKIVGTIIKFDLNKWISVVWDHNSSNVYKEKDLELYKQQTQLNLFGDNFESNSISTN